MQYQDLAALFDLQYDLRGDPWTAAHCQRVSDLASQFGRSLGCTSDEVNDLQIAGRLHDCGKITAFRDGSLINSNRLQEDFTQLEHEQIWRHPIHSAELIKMLDLSDRVVDLILHHHCRDNQLGYPHESARVLQPTHLHRIIWLCDSWDAMTSQRPYSQPLTQDQAVLSLNNDWKVGKCDRTITEDFIRWVTGIG